MIWRGRGETEGRHIGYMDIITQEKKMIRDMDVMMGKFLRVIVGWWGGEAGE